MEHINFHLYLDVAYRRKWLIIIPVLAFTALGVILALTLPPYYRSTTVIRVEKQQVPESYVQPTDKTPFSQRVNTLRQQIMSRQKLIKIINDFHLYQDSSSVNSFIAVMSRLGLNIKTKPLSGEELLDLMTRDIEARVIGGSAGDAFSISYAGTDPNVTMQVTSTLASFFIEENLKAREQYAEGTSDFLANELENSRKVLEGQERSVRAFKEKYRGALPSELDTNLRTLDRLQMDLQTIINGEKSAEDRKVMLEAQLNQPIDAPITASPATPPNPLALELQKLQRDLAGLRSQYKETYPDVVITKKRINEIKELLKSGNNNDKNLNDKENGDFEETKPEVRNPTLYNSLVTAKSEFATLKQREEDVRKKIQNLEKRVEETPANEQKYIDLSRDYNISLKNYQNLLEKKLNANLSENLEKWQKGERFTILDPANLPEKPYKPNRILVVFISIFAGTGTGFGLAMLFEFLNPAFRRAEDFEGVMNLPVLAVIPEFPSRRNLRYGKNLSLTEDGMEGEA